MVKKTYKELLDGLKYSDLGYTGERKPLTDPKYKQFTDTINKNTVIANTHIDSSLPPQMPQAQVSGQGTTIPTAKVDGQNPWNKTRRNAGLQDPKATEASTVGSETTVGGAVPTETPLTIDAKYSDFTKWAQEHGVDSDKVFQDAMALARSQYEQSRATYGLQAEQLAQAGLTNSGVSDNLERHAYTAKVQAEQAALDQKAALDQANKQGFAQYQEQQKQQQQQYTNLYQQLVDGYEDEYGNFHAGVSPEMAIAQLKFAGLTDETMIAEAQKAYDTYKGVYDTEVADKQNAIGGIVTDDNGASTFDANSTFGKLFSGELSSEDFLDQIEADYHVRYGTDEEAVDALRANNTITKEMASMYYRKRAESSLEAIGELGTTAKSMLRDADSELFNAVYSAHEAYKAGKMSKADWDAFKERLFDGSSDVSFTVTAPHGGGETRGIEYTLKCGGTTYTATINGVAVSGKDKPMNARLDKASNGGDYAVVDNTLYIRANGQWHETEKVYGKGQKNLKAMLKMLAE